MADSGSLPFVPDMPHALWRDNPATAADPVAVLDRYVSDGIGPGGQLVVWHRDELVIDQAVGDGRPGTPMAADTKIRLDCAVKPVLALGVLWLRQRGLMATDVPVGTYIPEFACHGKESVTAHHLLTHTAGPFRPPGAAPYRTAPAVLQQGLFAGRRTGGVPGQIAAYDQWGGWFTLAAIIERVTTGPWPQFLAETVLAPIGAEALELVPGDADDPDRLELPYRSLRRGTAFPVYRLDLPEALRYPNPAYGGYASSETLATIYRVLGDRDRCRDLLGVDPEPMRIPQRPELYDSTFGVECAMACGMFVRLDRWNYSAGISASAFGHPSNAGTWGFCDPENELVVALRMNGAPSDLNQDYRGPGGHPVISALYRMLA